MTCAKCGVLALGITLAAASLIRAQAPEPPRLLRIFREEIRSGKNAAHEKLESDNARALSNSGYPSYIALNSISGANEAWFLEGYDSYESMEDAILIARAEPLKTTRAKLEAQDGELRAGQRTLIAAYHPDLSYLPAPLDLAKARFARISTIQVRPGRAGDFEEMRALLNAALAQRSDKLHQVVYSVTSGAPAGTYVVLTVMDSLKAMDPPLSGMTLPEAFGAQNLARYEALEADIFISAESVMLEVNPRMSNPSKEFVEEDPDFWAPRPKPAPAKPPASQ